ncbi:MAG TPA: hypothetical protein VFU43_22535 [Streptosporangiaceae bacterium]|nr:hypothetical protein [Streptosporangiaceae bacterium]
MTPRAADETDEKLKLIHGTYEEVLDATKHQDDKIGRLLTSIAFLTAATLALAALSSASFVTRTFETPPFTLPLGLISLAVFLIGVVFTVMLLLTSLATPLRLPGLAESSHRPPMAWIRGVPASQLYFREIAGVSLDEWEDKWGASVDELKKERFVSYVRETHNLGVRTNAKYDRTTESVALLSLSLLAFALAVVFVAIAAGSPDAPAVVHLEPLHRVVIGLVMGSYVELQLLARIRYARQTIDETTVDKEQPRLGQKLRGEVWYAFLMAACVFDVLIFDSSYPAPALLSWIVATLALGAFSLVAFWRATRQDDKSAAASPTEAGRKKRRVRVGRQRRRVTVVTVLLLALAVFSGVNGWYAGQLGVATAAVLCLIVPSLREPSASIAKRRRSFQDRLDQRKSPAQAADLPRQIPVPIGDPITPDQLRPDGPTPV